MMVKWPLVGDDVGVISDPIILRISHIFVRPCTEVITSLLGMKFEYLKRNNKLKSSSGRGKNGYQLPSNKTTQQTKTFQMQSR